MVHRGNRRALVALTYIAFLSIMVTLILLLPPGRHQINAVWICMVLAYNVVSRLVFGKLVSDTVLPQPRVKLSTLGLAAGQHHREDDLDEREIAVRDAAYFRAYQVLAVYSIVVWFISPLTFELTASTALRVFQFLTLPLVAIALTLPQAIVLCCEPDVPEEAMVR